MDKINVYNVPSVHAQPSITLRPWLILECRNGKRYAMGWNVGDREGRASTAIESFERETMTLLTASGRVYKLDGEPGLDADASYVWEVYARVNGYQAVADVSADYWPDWKGAQGRVIDTKMDEVKAFLEALGKPRVEAS